MAMLADVKWNNIIFNDAYVAYYKHIVRKKSENSIDSISNHTFICTIEVHIYTNDTKEQLLTIEEVTFSTDDIHTITCERIWEEVKKKYKGKDII